MSNLRNQNALSRKKLLDISGKSSLQTTKPFVRYEDRLAQNPRWALSDASDFFLGKGEVQTTLQRITKRLDELAIPYAVVGGLALFKHGFRRFTEDVDLLVTPQSLRALHAKLDGLGYVPPFEGSKNLRDTSTGVKIEFLVTGQFPGDGKPKGVVFPDPTAVTIELDGIKYLNLNTLIELKIAAGMTSPDRPKDFTDINELIKAVNLARNLADQLNPYVRSKYLEIWDVAHSVKRRFVQIWRNKFLSVDAKTLEDITRELRAAADLLAAMKADGVTLDSKGGTTDDYALLVTEDPLIAEKYGMHDERELWEDEESSTK